MRWVDVCGAPGSGKSTLCDGLWSPHAIKWDGWGVPDEWDPLMKVADELLEELKDHPTYSLLLGMTKRSLMKMGTVHRRQNDGVYIQTGLAQRGLGFGWRLNERGRVELVRDYFRVMPVSLGVAIVTCPIDVAQERNRLREEVSATAHENRSHMVPLMDRPIEILKEEMDARGVSTIEIDSTKPIEDARRDLLRFAGQRAVDTTTPRPGGEMAFV